MIFILLLADFLNEHIVLHHYYYKMFGLIIEKNITYTYLLRNVMKCMAKIFSNFGENEKKLWVSKLSGKFIVNQ